MASTIGLSQTSDVLDHLEEWQIRRELQQYKPKPAPPNADKLSIYSFMWSDTEYTPRQLLDNFQHLTPFLVITTMGYLGRDECVNTVASDEVYWVKGVVKVRRLVVKNKSNNYFSIPVNNSMKIVPCNENGEPVAAPTTLKQYCDKESRKDGTLDQTRRVFKFTDKNKQTVYQGADQGESVRLGILEIVDQYDERHLMVHSLCSGSIYHSACVIPIYMPIAMSIAVAMETNEHKDFYRTMLDMYNYVNEVPLVIAFPKDIQDYDEIMVYHQKPKEGEYEYLHYLSLQPPSRKAPATNLYTTLPPSIPLPELPPEAKQEPQKDKEEEVLDQRGGSRGKESNIHAMSQQGYGVIDVEPLEALEELVEVLCTRKIPEDSRVSKKIVSIHVQEVYTEPTPPPSPSSKRHVQLPVDTGPPPEIPERSRKLPQVQRPLHADLLAELNRGRSSLRRTGSSDVPEANIQSVSNQMYNSASRTARSGPGTFPAHDRPSLARRDKPPAPPRTGSQGGPNPAPTKHHQTSPPTSPQGGYQGRINLAQHQPTNKPRVIRTISDIPSDISALNTDNLGECLVLLKLGKHRKKFEEEQIDGSLLMDLDNSILQDDFGFSKFEVKKLMNFVGGWRPNIQSAPSEQGSESNL